MKRPHFTKRYARYRIRNPKRFIKNSLRTHDIGRRGHSKRIAGKLQRSGRWATQAILITRNDYKKGMRVKKKGKRWIIAKVKK